MAILTVAVIFCSVISIINAVGCLLVWTEVRAMQKSTHQVQYVNLPNEDFQKMTKDLEDKLTKKFYDNII